MKAAKEMFEELGYELEPEETYAGDKILPYRCYKKNNGITFYLKEKQFVKTKRVSDCIAIKESELKAIIQQCKELGWLEEKDEHFEETAETNAEHYLNDLLKIGRHFCFMHGKVKNCCDVGCAFCTFGKANCDKERFKWLASPYKNPAYKLSQFEYDLINAFDRCKECCLLNEIECLKKLREKGYFNGIDPFTKVHEILDNCEVVG